MTDDLLTQFLFENCLKTNTIDSNIRSASAPESVRLPLAPNVSDGPNILFETVFQRTVAQLIFFKTFKLNLF